MTFIHPATIIVTGGTGSGKTVFTRSLIEHSSIVIEGIGRTPKVLWCYGIKQDFKPIANSRTVFHEGLVDEDDLKRMRPDILVVDDLMTEKSNDPFMHNLFVKVSHHMRITVIYITQNLYEKGQCKLKRNAHYLVLMRNPSDKGLLSTLASQLYPRNKRLQEHFYESYDDATSDRYGYLLIDVSPESDEKQKLKTNVFPSSDDSLRVIVYQPR